MYLFKIAIIRDRVSHERVRVTQLHTDGNHCQRPTGTGPVNFEVVPNECCLNRSALTN